MPGTLFVVALPIGNLSDITLRAIETLKSADYVLAEDTRDTRRVLDRYEIETPFYSSLYQGVEAQRVDDIVRLLLEGKSVALVSDAGTPLISDPGFPLVRRAIEAGIDVRPVPGPTAMTCALVGSGLPTDRFCFEGALPRRRGPRRALFESLRDEPRTVVFYESPHRLAETLRLLSEALPERRVVLARELTKLHEEFLRGPASDIAATLASRGEIRGECVLVVEGTPERPMGPEEKRAIAIASLLREAGTPKTVIEEVLALAFGMSRNEAYETVHRPAPPN
jgi:16S rRNA (cytidine1402-2'-O)-methyltransferase